MPIFPRHFDAELGVIPACVVSEHRCRDDLPQRPNDRIARYRTRDAAARKALAESTAQERYKGARVSIPAELPPAEVKAVAEQAKLEASRLLGSASMIVLLAFGYYVVVYRGSHLIGRFIPNGRLKEWLFRERGDTRTGTGRELQ